MFLQLFAAALCCIFSFSAHAGAWLQPQGDGQFIGSASYYSTNRYFDAEGKKQKQQRFRKYELQPYVEYGLFDNLTIGGSAYAQALKQGGGSNYGIADPEFFARTRIWHDDKQVVSIQPLIKLGSRFESKNPPRGGSKSTDAELSILYGRNLNLISDRDYVDSRTGYRLRNHGLSDQWRTDSALGLGVTDHLTIIPALHATVSTAMTKIAGYTESGDLDYTLVKADITAMYQVTDQQWIQAAAAKDLMGTQTGNGYAVSIGFGQRF